MLHILIAEDNALSRKVLLRMLSGLECVVTAVENGRQVLEAVQAQHYDLVLMDVRMPDLDGITTTRQMLRMLPAAEWPTIYAVTAGVSNEERRECIDAGMAGFLDKPVQLEALRTLIASLQS